GITVLTDPTGDATDMLASHDIQSISIGEPWFPDGSQKIVFTLKMASLSPLPPNTAWRVYFFFPGNTLKWVDMETDAAGMVTYNVNNGTTTVAADAGTNAA